MRVLELGVYAVVLAAAAAAVWRRPVVALYLFVVGLALHNAAMAALYGAGVRGSTLSAVAAWKEILLAVGVARVATDALRARRLPFSPSLVDALALAFGGLVLVYAVIPQSALGGSAGHRAVALALRHDLVPVGAYFLGRALRLGLADLRRLAWTLLGAAAAVAVGGLVEVYAVPIGWWRGNGVVDYFHRQLGYDYHGTGRRLEPGGAVYGLPENFIYNVGGDRPFLRRLVSTFLSPLASGYLFVVALLAAQWLRSRTLVLALSAAAFAGLLWTFSRASLVALAGGLLVLGALRRRPLELAAGLAVVAVAVAWAHVFPHVGPTGRFTKVDLEYQHRIAAAAGGDGSGGGRTSFTATSPNEPSLSEHWRSLKDGIRTMTHHPQGYGLGNVGQTASRTETPLKAGESNYTELGVEVGVLGAVLWLAWGLALLAGLVRAGLAETWVACVAAAFAAILALAVQTDVIGDPWVAYCVWGLAGAALTSGRPRPRAPASGRCTPTAAG